MSDRRIAMPIVEYPWQRWFAWYPVRLGEWPRPKGPLVWLRSIERRNVWFVNMWREYRMAQGAPNE